MDRLYCLLEQLQKNGSLFRYSSNQCVYVDKLEKKQNYECSMCNKTTEYIRLEGKTNLGENYWGAIHDCSRIGAPKLDKVISWMLISCYCNNIDFFV